MSENEGAERSRRWVRRDSRRCSRRDQVKKHGASLRRVYRDAVLKRLRDRKRK